MGRKASKSKCLSLQFYITASLCISADLLVCRECVCMYLLFAVFTLHADYVVFLLCWVE